MQDDMKFANNLEAMAFGKSTWNMVEKSADGKCIYMGRPQTCDAELAEPVWYIRRVVTVEDENGKQTIETKTAAPNGRVKWTEKEKCNYKFF